MIHYMVHPKHGKMPVYNQQMIEHNRQFGWELEDAEKHKAQVVPAVESGDVAKTSPETSTPPTRERASAEKDGRPNAGSIVYGVLFDVEDRSAFHNKNILPVGESVNKNIQLVYLLYAGVK